MSRALIRHQQNLAAMRGDFSMTPDEALLVAALAGDDFAYRYESHRAASLPDPVARGGDLPPPASPQPYNWRARALDLGMIVSGGAVVALLALACLGVRL